MVSIAPYIPVRAMCIPFKEGFEFVAMVAIASATDIVPESSSWIDTLTFGCSMLTLLNLFMASVRPVTLAVVMSNVPKSLETSSGSSPYFTVKSKSVVRLKVMILRIPMAELALNRFV
jgi:hypothetical protein